MNAGIFFVALTLLVAAFIAARAIRRPILFRMAMRNAARRPKQTATVIAGLMIGTAIISAALVAGQSATSAIREVVYESLGPIDETVRVDGYPFFPEAVFADFQADDDIAQFFDGASPIVLWQATADHEAEDLFEPAVTLIGFDPPTDVAFGPFETTTGHDDGTSIARGELILSSDLANRLEAEPGDRVVLAYSQPFDPVIPTLSDVQGTVGLSLDPDRLLPVSLEVPLIDPVPSDHTVRVEPGSTSITAFVVCADPAGTQPCPPGTQLELRLFGPDGTDVRATAPSPPTGPPVPVWLNHSAAPGDGLQPGDWTLRVGGVIAAQAPYVGKVIVLRPSFDPAELREALDELGDELEQLGLEPDALERRETRSFTVRAVTDGGRGDHFGFGFGQRAFLHLDELQDMLGRDGQINLIKFSNPGSTRTGVEQTDRAMELLNATLGDIQEARSDHAVVQELRVNPVKQDSLRTADTAGQLMTGLLIFAGSLSIITGLLLIINIFTMLAEERRSELGMARAVGLSRRDLVRLFVFEGSLYALGAALVGAVLGLGLAALMIAGLNALIASQGGTFPPIPFAPSPWAVPTAFSIGALLTFATIAVASRRQAKLNVVRAIRGIAEPDKSGPRWLPFVGLPLAATGLFTLVLGWVVAAVGDEIFYDGVQADWLHFSMRILGAVVLAVGLRMSLLPFLRRKRIDVTVAGSLAAYLAATFFLITKYENIEEANIVGPLRGVIMTLCIVVLFSYWETGPRMLGKLLGSIKSLRAISIPAVAYPQHKRFRTGMTLAMFSIVILSIGFFSIFGALFETDPARQTGGYDVEATTTLDVDDLAAFDAGLLPAGLVQSVDHIAEFTTFEDRYVTVEGELTGHFGPPHHHFFGVDPDFVDHQNFRLLWTLDGLSEREAYEQLFVRDDVVVVAYTYSTDEQGRDLSNEVGDTMQIYVDGYDEPPREYTIIGIQEQYHFPGIFLPKQTVESFFPTTDDFYLFKLDPAADPDEAAKLLERNYRAAGMNAEASETIVAKEQEGFRQILGAMKLFLGLGLIVGVLSLGIITSRSVLERRQEIGMLRALGYTGKQVRRIFLIEVSLIVFLGTLIGLVCSIWVTYGLWFSVIRELQYPYIIPWAEVGLMLAASYLVAVLATVAPILRAAKIAPAEALRYVE